MTDDMLDPDYGLPCERGIIYPDQLRATGVPASGVLAERPTDPAKIAAMRALMGAERGSVEQQEAANDLIGRCIRGDA